MKVYLLYEDVRYEGSLVIGVYASYDDAYEEQKRFDRQNNMSDVSYRIREVNVVPQSSRPQ